MKTSKVRQQFKRSRASKYVPWISFSFLLCCLMLISCGGGGGDSAPAPTPPPAASATLTGTVSGTTVIAYDLDGKEVARAVATGTGVQKSFTITVPIPGKYKFYLIENEQTNPRVYPLYQDATNVFSIDNGGTIDLGFVDTASGRAVPANNPLNVSGVTSGGESASLPAAIAGYEYKLSDLDGTKYVLQLWTGVSADGTSKVKGWGHAISTTTGGLRQYTEFYRNNGNNALPADATLSILPCGRARNSNYTDATFVGYVTGDRKWFISLYTGQSTTTPPYDYYGLAISMKYDPSKTYALSDLEGDWHLSNLDVSITTGRERWWRGETHTGAAGLTGWTNYSDSNGYTSATNTWTLNIADPAKPVLNAVGSTSYYGIIGDSKDFYLRTSTTAYTDVTPTEYRYGLTCAQRKTPGVTFSTADLEGVWHYFALVGGATRQANNWVYGKMMIESGGKFSFTSLTQGADTGPQDLPSGTFSVDSGGGIMQISAITGGDVPEGFQGYISADKQLVIVTMTETADDGSKTYTAGIMIR